MMNKENLNKLQELISEKLFRDPNSTQPVRNSIELLGIEAALDKGISFIENTKEMKHEEVYHYFNNEISLEVEKLMKKKEELAGEESTELECEIAYSENLIKSLHLLKGLIIDVLDNESKKVSNEGQKTVDNEICM